MCFPTLVTQDEYATLRDFLPEIIPIEELKELLVDFNMYSEGAGLNFDDKKLKIKNPLWKTDPPIVEATNKLKNVLVKLNDLAGKVIYHAKRLDPLKYLDNMSEADELVVKFEIVKNLNHEFPEDFNENTYMASLGKSLRYMFNQ